MHVKRASNGKKKVVMSRKEWELIGKRAGWEEYDKMNEYAPEPQSAQRDRKIVEQAAKDMWEQYGLEPDPHILKALVVDAMKRAKTAQEAIELVHEAVRLERQEQLEGEEGEGPDWKRLYDQAQPESWSELMENEGGTTPWRLGPA